VSWLDLGWLKRGESWEFYPWGPFSRGYCVDPNLMPIARRRIRRVRGGVLLLAGLALALRYGFGSWLLTFLLLGAAALMEGLLTWRVIRSCPRTDRGLGGSAGLLYLVQWLRPKVLTVARILVILLLGFSIWLIWREPGSWESYLLAGFFMVVLWVLFYLEQVQDQRGGEQ
jgi:hypothetical protein